MIDEKEWPVRIAIWLKELENHFFHELGVVTMTGFQTKENLSIFNLDDDFKSMPTGTKWGENWEYGWFRGKILLPNTAAKKRIVVCPDVGGECAVFLNGKLAGAVDTYHKYITLCIEGVPGITYDLTLESYAGHGARIWTAGPIPPERQWLPESEDKQVTVGVTRFGIWDEDAYQLWIDAETLYKLRNSIDSNSLRAVEIDKGLKDFVHIVDFERSYDERISSFRDARHRLERLLRCSNGSTVPRLYTFGHSHIDIAWLWPIAETARKCGRTFSTQIALMDEYPEYKFLQSQPFLYELLKKQYPELYIRFKDKILEGRIIPEGAMWVESDTNLPCGESLIRQLLYGMRYFQEEFGINCKILWLPDAFGFSGALPQILQECGIEYFATAKLLWNYGNGEEFPYITFTWEGIDGSSVIAHVIHGYGSRTDPETIVQRWNSRRQKEGISSRLYPFGYGDGGGGATRDHLEYLQRESDLEGMPKMQMCHPVEFFEELKMQGLPEAKYVGELYFPAHRGSYTSQAETKRCNRKSEFALREAEFWSLLASKKSHFEYPQEKIESAWKDVLTNQFHDILPGTSIARVHEEAVDLYDSVIKRMNSITHEAISTLVSSGDGLVIFNSFSWERKALVELPSGWESAFDDSGTVLPIQLNGSKLLVEVNIPSCGWITINQCQRQKYITQKVSVNKSKLENKFLRVVFDDWGRMISCFDKETCRELCEGPCNEFRMYRDVPNNWDAWDIDESYISMQILLSDKAEISIGMEGPLISSIIVTRKLNQSFMKQEISLKHDSRTIEFDTTIQWNERHKLLKAAFPIDIQSDIAVHEIQFGHVRRPNHNSRRHDADRFEVVNQKWTALMEEGRGIAILNDSRYGVSVPGNSIQLTLLKAAIAPDPMADRGSHHFVYAFHTWNKPFVACDVIRKAYELNNFVKTVRGAAGTMSMFTLTEPNIILETLKGPEDKTNSAVLRLYEAKRNAATFTLHSAMKIISAYDCDMHENRKTKLKIDENSITLSLAAFQIRTIILNFD